MFLFHTDKHSVFIPYSFQAIFLQASWEQETGDLSLMILFCFQIIPSFCERGLKFSYRAELGIFESIKATRSQMSRDNPGALLN